MFKQEKTRNSIIISLEKFILLQNKVDYSKKYEREMEKFAFLYGISSIYFKDEGNKLDLQLYEALKKKISFEIVECQKIELCSFECPTELFGAFI